MSLLLRLGYRKNCGISYWGPGKLRRNIKWALGGNAATLSTLYKCLTRAAVILDT
jgi:hypothetical protein